MWDSKPKKITSATLGLETKIAPTVGFLFFCNFNPKKKKKKKIRMF